MIVEKVITTTQATTQADVDITEITLLSVEEAEKLDEDTRYIGDPWWLRSPGDFDDFAAIVNPNGVVYADGSYVDSTYGVRPALTISNLQASNLRIGDQFILADEQWTVIGKDKALCDDIVGRAPFRKAWKAPDANDYEKSDVKRWLKKWLSGKGIKL